VFIKIFSKQKDVNFLTIAMLFFIFSHRVIGQFETTQNDLVGYASGRPSMYNVSTFI